MKYLKNLIFRFIADVLYYTFPLSSFMKLLLVVLFFYGKKICMRKVLFKFDS